MKRSIVVGVECWSGEACRQVGRHIIWFGQTLLHYYYYMLGSFLYITIETMQSKTHWSTSFFPCGRIFPFPSFGLIPYCVQCAYTVQLDNNNNSQFSWFDEFKLKTSRRSNGGKNWMANTSRIGGKRRPHYLPRIAEIPYTYFVIVFFSARKNERKLHVLKPPIFLLPFLYLAALLPWLFFLSLFSSNK